MFQTLFKPEREVDHRIWVMSTMAKVRFRIVDWISQPWNIFIFVFQPWNLQNHLQISLCTLAILSHKLGSSLSFLGCLALLYFGDL